VAGADNQQGAGINEPVEGGDDQLLWIAVVDGALGDQDDMLTLGQQVARGKACRCASSIREERSYKHPPGIHLPALVLEPGNAALEDDILAPVEFVEDRAMHRRQTMGREDAVIHVPTSRQENPVDRRGQQLMDQAAGGRSGRLEPTQVWRDILRPLDDSGYPYAADMLAENLTDETRRHEAGIAEQHIEVELVIDLTDVLEVSLDISEEEVRKREAELSKRLQSSALFRKQVGDGADLTGALEGQMGDSEALEPLSVARAGIPADVVPNLPQVDRNSGERVEVAVQRERGEQDLHGALDVEEVHAEPHAGLQGSWSVATERGVQRHEALGWDLALRVEG
jgi:hypothetical protein